MEKVMFKGSAMLNPVPVVLISCKNTKGKDNVFTVGWIGTACTKPPMITVAIRPERLSYEYIKETMEFVVNLPSKDLVKKVDFCGVRSGKTIDKIKEMNFTMKECENISASLIDECPISLECKVKNITPLGTHDLFLAEVICSHINSDLIDNKGKIHFEKANLISYCHGEYFQLNSKSLGSFGYSVMKKKTLKKKRLKK
ncbi:MAG: flavin reductase family protein [Clostridium argentinense]|uniref:Flavin reductase family protein n=1 Tax=Clostridium faecium TaxID=2762223 RepID=A0ABR8YTG0_9CLOT|nr:MULTISPECIES: flavin reductase family protein [Clostridium]MBD8047273.1 flavin reductase family protein [Clostridium faecium]MBS5822537.1 flavin reductase family protein [Clostridium argentinense]MDU1347976.1 flavin reductase family protein [Clostridium argentinense]